LGILGTILTRVGLPLGLIALAGILIFRFKDPILSAIGGGASTIGQAITTPIGALLQGVQAGFANIPQNITFTVPSFDFVFGQSDPNNDPIGQLQTDFDNFIKNTQAFFDNLFKSGGGGSGTPPGTLPLPPGEFPLDEETAGGSLTAFETASGKFVTTSSTGGQGQVTMTETLQQILERNREAVGLFDFTFTEQTEFFALSPAEIQFFGAENLVFSGQLFQEIKNLEEAMAFG